MCILGTVIAPLYISGSNLWVLSSIYGCGDILYIDSNMYYILYYGIQFCCLHIPYNNSLLGPFSAFNAVYVSLII